jgi:hypothetical protein
MLFASNDLIVQEGGQTQYQGQTAGRRRRRRRGTRRRRRTMAVGGRRRPRK